MCSLHHYFDHNSNMLLLFGYLPNSSHLEECSAKEIAIVHNFYDLNGFCCREGLLKTSC